jgi:predicted metal-dependent phosphotriesterase family hydrolase
MNEERMQILRMVEERKISAEEAARLLDALEPQEETAGSGEAKKVRIRVTDIETQQHKVNLSIPLGLAKIAMKFIPPKTKRKLAEEGVDVDAVMKQVLTENIGKIVDIETEDELVQIYVE